MSDNELKILTIEIDDNLSSSLNNFHNDLVNALCEEISGSIIRELRIGLFDDLYTELNNELDFLLYDEINEDGQPDIEKLFYNHVLSYSRIAVIIE